MSPRSAEVRKTGWEGVLLQMSSGEEAGEEGGNGPEKGWGERGGRKERRCGDVAPGLPAASVSTGEPT